MPWIFSSKTHKGIWWYMPADICTVLDKKWKESKSGGFNGFSVEYTPANTAASFRSSYTYMFSWDADMDDGVQENMTTKAIRHIRPVTDEECDGNKYIIKGERPSRVHNEEMTLDNLYDNEDYHVQTQTSHIFEV